MRAGSCLGISRWLSLCEIVLKHRNLGRTECSARVSDAKVEFGDCWVLATISSVTLGREVLPPLLKVRVLKVVSGFIFLFSSKELRERSPTSHPITTTASWAQGN